MIRPHGEVVHCFLRTPQVGIRHTGRASGVQGYTWLDQDSDEEPSCGCLWSLLEADITQLGSAVWAWRSYDKGCDNQHRMFAVGKRRDLAKGQWYIERELAGLENSELVASAESTRVTGNS